MTHSFDKTILVEVCDFCQAPNSIKLCDFITRLEPTSYGLSTVLRPQSPRAGRGRARVLGYPVGRVRGHTEEPREPNSEGRVRTRGRNARVRTSATVLHIRRGRVVVAVVLGHPLRFDDVADGRVAFFAFDFGRRVDEL